MDKLLKEYIIRKENNYTEYDKNYVKFIIDNLDLREDEMTLDCHGLLCDELLYFLEFLDIIQMKTFATFITGSGNHSKKPKMDYMSSKLWRSPLKKVVIDYYVKTGRGACIKELPSYVVIRLR